MDRQLEAKRRAPAMSRHKTRPRFHQTSNKITAGSGTMLVLLNIPQTNKT